MPGEGYIYVNESTIWQPIMVSYALLISGAALLIFALIGYLFNKYQRYIPASILTGASMFFSVMLGPLGDLLEPHRALEFVLSPHIFPSEEHPGVSTIAVYAGVLWPIGVILTIIFGLLYFSYPMHIKAEKGGRLRVLYRIFSLGVTTRERYESLSKLTKVIGVILLFVLIPWLFYPGILFVSQTNTFAWSIWELLPVINAGENIVLALSVLLFVFYVQKSGKLVSEDVEDIIKATILVAFSLLILIGLQEVMWYLRYGGSEEYATLSIVLSGIYLVEALLVITLIIGIINLKLPNLTIITSILGIITIVASKWNVIVNAQRTSKLGLGILELELHANWFLAFLAPISFAVLLWIILTWIFPTEVIEE